MLGSWFVKAWSHDHGFSVVTAWLTLVWNGECVKMTITFKGWSRSMLSTWFGKKSVHTYTAHPFLLFNVCVWVDQSLTNTHWIGGQGVQYNPVYVCTGFLLNQVLHSVLRNWWSFSRILRPHWTQSLNDHTEAVIVWPDETRFHRLWYHSGNRTVSNYYGTGNRTISSYYGTGNLIISNYYSNGNRTISNYCRLDSRSGELEYSSSMSMSRLNSPGRMETMDQTSHSDRNKKPHLSNEVSIRLYWFS